MSEDDKKHFPIKGDSRETFEANRFEDEHLQRVHSQLMREKEEPTENFSPMPLFLVGLFMVMAFWAGVYLVHNSGDFGPFHYDETKKPGEGVASGPVEVDMVALGKRVYAQNCVACHQSSGMGLPNVYPPLVNSDWVQDDPHRLINIVLAGMAGPIEVNGKQYNNAMTPFGSLSDQQIAAVLTMIRTEAQYQNNSYEVSEELVAEVRAEYGSRNEPWSQPELDAIYGAVDGQWEPPVVEAPAEEPSTEEATTPEGEEAPVEEEATEEAEPAPEA